MENSVEIPEEDEEEEEKARSPSPAARNSPPDAFQEEGPPEE